jgi:hypothetical protein
MLIASIRTFLISPGTVCAIIKYVMIISNSYQISKAYVKNMVNPIKRHIPPKIEFCAVPNLKMYAKDFTV